MAINGAYRRAQEMKQNNNKKETSKWHPLIWASFLSLLCVCVLFTSVAHFGENFNLSMWKKMLHNLRRSNWENKIGICNYYLFTWWLFNRKYIVCVPIPIPVLGQTKKSTEKRREKWITCILWVQSQYVYILHIWGCNQLCEVTYFVLCTYMIV